MTSNIAHLQVVLEAAQRLLTAREDDMITGDEWEALANRVCPQITTPPQSITIGCRKPNCRMLLATPSTAASLFLGFFSNGFTFPIGQLMTFIDDHPTTHRVD